jgi:hypothetical protein
MLVQSVENHTATRADPGEDRRLKELVRAIYRGMHLPGGNPGTAVRLAVRRLAGLQWQAERCRAFDLPPLHVDALERSIARAERALARIVGQRRLAQRRAERGPGVDELMRWRDAR